MEAARHRVVVGVDGSEGSRVALTWAMAEAARRRADVEVVAAFPVDVVWLDPLLIDQGRVDDIRADTGALAQGMVDDARQSGTVSSATDMVDVTVRVVAGPPAPRLVQRSEDAALLVVGSRGRNAVRSVLGGSVALHCATHARCPVVVVPPAAGPAEVSARVVVGVDDSSHGRAALAAAVEHAGRTGATVDAIFAYEGPQYWSEVYVDVVLPAEELERQALERARAVVTDVVGEAPLARGEVAVRAVEGTPGSVLVREAVGARLLVVGSQSRHSLEGLVLGSVALHCVTSAPCPVLVVRGLPETPAAEAEPVRAAVDVSVG